MYLWEFCTFQFDEKGAAAVRGANVPFLARPFAEGRRPPTNALRLFFADA
jgi:hypothetical protein